MKYLLMFLCAALAAASPATHADNVALRAKYVRVTFDLAVDGTSLGSPVVTTEIARPGRVAVLDGEASYRLDYTVREVFAGQDGQPIADLAIAIHRGGAAGWTLLAEPETKLVANGERADMTVAGTDRFPRITLGTAVQPLTAAAVTEQFGGLIPDGSVCPDADATAGSAKAGDCCGGQCADGRRWECCGALQCCNVCPGAQCCRPK